MKRSSWTKTMALTLPTVAPRPSILPNLRRTGGYILACLALSGAAFTVRPTVVVGHSMEPTLKDRRVILVDRTRYLLHRPQRGEVVVFRHGGSSYVKRVYRTAGENIYSLGAHGDDFLPIREGRMPEMKQRYAGRSASLGVREIKVPADHLWVLGDNYQDSEDSRQMGPIPMEDVIGRAMVPVDQTVMLGYEMVPPRSPLPRSARSTRVSSR